MTPTTSRGSLFDRIVWSVARCDDFLIGVLGGLLCSFVLRPERPTYRRIEEIVSAVRAGKEIPQPAAVRGGATPLGTAVVLPGDGRYVVLSDHHLLYAGSPHDYVGGGGMHPFDNERILARMLAHYESEGYTLIENGDVEDLVVLEPEAALGILSVFLQGFGLLRRWSNVRPQRQRQLARVHKTYAGLMAFIRERFHDKGRFVKLFGNHEEALRQPELLADLRKVYPGLTMYDFAVVSRGAEAPVLICHGHQLDPWTHPHVAPWIGESITESFAWAGQGADRIWLRRAWFKDLASRENVASRAPRLVIERGAVLPKVRHMGEEPILERFAKDYKADPPWLVLGHSHEPRLLDGAHGRVERYVNSGAVGRYQDLVWCVEIAGGLPTLHAWYSTDGRLYRIRYIARRDSLEPAGEPVDLGPLGELPWSRPSEEEVRAAGGPPRTGVIVVNAVLRALGGLISISPLLILAALAYYLWYRLYGS